MDERLDDRSLVAGTETTATTVAEQIRRVAELGFADRILIDTRIDGAGGGTGVAFDWVAAQEVFATAPSGIQLLVAGGLKPENVARAIAGLRPYGVDVSSGVEALPGEERPGEDDQVSCTGVWNTSALTSYV